MIRFTLRQLSYFLATAETGSTLRAAESLNISQPSISIGVAQLEEAFGQKLFVRHHAQGVTLTAFGRRKLAEVRHLMAHVNTVANVDKDGELSGELSLGVFSTLAAAFIPGLLRSFAQQHPKVRVRMRELTLDQIHRDLDAGMIELALLYELDTIEQMITIPLAAFPHYAVLPKGHALESRSAIYLRELASEPFVLIDLPHSRDHFLSLFRNAGIMPTEVIRCASLETVRGLVGHGHGLSILITRPYGDHTHDGMPLVCKPIADPAPPQRIILGSAARAPLTPIAQAFAEKAKAFFASLPENTA